MNRKLIEHYLALGVFPAFREKEKTTPNIACKTSVGGIACPVLCLP
jgi:hypothetical protein